MGLIAGVVVLGWIVAATYEVSHSGPLSSRVPSLESLQKQLRVPSPSHFDSTRLESESKFKKKWNKIKISKTEMYFKKKRRIWLESDSSQKGSTTFSSRKSKSRVAHI